MPIWLAVPVWVVDLTTTDGGLGSGGQTGQWEWGVPTAGPVGETSWGTNLDGPYLHDTIDWVEVALPDLTGVADPLLVLDHWYEIRTGDQTRIELDAGAGFLRVEPVYGYPDPLGFVGLSGGWVSHVFPLDGAGAAGRVRVTLEADATLTDAGWYVRAIAVWDGDILPPLVTVTSAPVDTQDLVGPYEVEVLVVDDVGAASSTLWVALDGAAAAPVAMVPKTGDLWSASIPAQPPDTTVDWWVETTDGENVGRWPAVGTETFRVFLAAPLNLATAADPGRVATEVALVWDPPVSPNEVLGYDVWRTGAVMPIASVTERTAVVPLGQDPQVFWVTADYAAGRGDASASLDLALEVPTLTTLEPSTGYQGEDLHLWLEGRSLYLLQDDVTLDFGEGVTLTGIDVRDAHALVAHVTVEPDARVGPSDVTLGTTAGTFVFPGRFEIRDGADAPRIRRIAPAAIVQGAEAEVELDATVPFAAVPEIGTDEDLLVTGGVTVDGTTARFVVAVSGRARVGLHSLSVDDGERLYTIDLQVEEYVARVEQRCGGCRATPMSGLFGVFVVVAALRRRLSNA